MDIRYFFVVFCVLFLLALPVQSVSVSSVAHFSADVSCAERQSPGFICFTCDLLAMCLKLNGAWETVILEGCDGNNGFHCNSKLGRCSNETGPCNPNLAAFICNSVGIIPDPFDCQTYHMCHRNGESMIAVDMYCGAGLAFNPARSDCSLKTDHDICDGYKFKCDKAGDAGPWPMNANMFYVCVIAVEEGRKVLYPSMYRCPASQVFNGVECVDDNDTPTDDYDCPSPGLHANPRNCREYFYCSYDLKAEKHTCPIGTYFNPSTAACLVGNCQQ